MNEFEAYREYVWLKLHFTDPEADYFHSPKRVHLSAYEKRPDRHYFKRLAKHQDPRGVILANMLKDPLRWIGEIVQEDGVYADWARRRDSMTYTVKRQLSSMGPCDARAAQGHPELLRKHLAGEVDPETLAVLFIIDPELREEWKKKSRGDPVWEEVVFKIEKYVPFLSIDPLKFKEVA